METPACTAGVQLELMVTNMTAVGMLGAVLSVIMFRVLTAMPISMHGEATEIPVVAVVDCFAAVGLSCTLLCTLIAVLATTNGTAALAQPDSMKLTLVTMQQMELVALNSVSVGILFAALSAIAVIWIKHVEHLKAVAVVLTIAIIAIIIVAAKYRAEFLCVPVDWRWDMQCVNCRAKDVEQIQILHSWIQGAGRRG